MNEIKDSMAFVVSLKARIKGARISSLFLEP